MKTKILRFFKLHWNKILPVFFFVALLCAYVSTFAVFTPGQTLDPNCAPTDPDCTVLLTSSGSSQWSDTTGGIYYNSGNINIGSVSGSISSSMGDRNSFSNIYEQGIENSSINKYISISVDDNNNPVIAYYKTPVNTVGFNFIKSAEAGVDNSDLIIIRCLDTECANDPIITSIDNDFSLSNDINIRPSLKIGSDNLVRVAYMTENSDFSVRNIKYAECNNIECTSPIISTIATSEFIGYGFSLALDSEDNPFIIYNDYNTDSGSYSVYLARYTNGTENTCSSGDTKWRCTSATPEGIDYFLNGNYLSGYGGYGSQGGNSNILSIDFSSGFPSFLADTINESRVSRMDYFVCDDVDCSTSYPTRIDSINFGANYLNNDSINSGGGAFSYVLLGGDYSTNRILYNKTFTHSGITDLKIASPASWGDTERSNNCINRDWNCSSFYRTNNDGESSYISDFKLDTNGFPIVIITNKKEEGTDNDGNAIYSQSNTLIKCSDINCLHYTSTEFNYYQYTSDIYPDYLSRPITNLVLNSDDEVYVSYFDIENSLLKIDKEVVYNGLSFIPDGNDTYVDGDLGIHGNMFIDNGLSLSDGLYLSDNEPNSTINTLYNVGGDLYWNGSFINTGVLELPESLIVSTSVFGNETWLGGNPEWVNEEIGPGVASKEYTVFIGIDSGWNASLADYSIFIGNNTGYEATNASDSNFIGYNAGIRATDAVGSNFFGSYAGSHADGAYNSNFLGSNAGRANDYWGSSSSDSHDSNFFGGQSGYRANNAPYSNFFGSDSGYLASNAANSIFIGTSAGYQDPVNNTAAWDDYSTFADTSILIGHKTSTGGYSNSIAIGAYATNTAANQFMIGSTTRPINTTRFQGATTECTITTGTGIACTSDERLKTITSPLNIDPNTGEEISILDKLTKVKTVNFKWNDNIDGNNNIGFLAQDLYNYFPELVNGNPDNTDEYLSVYYSNMTPIIVEAIREMDLTVKDLSSLDTTSATSLGSMIKNFLEDAGNGIQLVIFGEIRTDKITTKEFCVSEDECLNEEELQTLIQEFKDSHNIEPSLEEDDDLEIPPVGDGDFVEGDISGGDDYSSGTPS